MFYSPESKAGTPPPYRDVRSRMPCLFIRLLEVGFDPGSSDEEAIKFSPPKAQAVVSVQGRSAR